MKPIILEKYQIKCRVEACLLNKESDSEEKDCFTSIAYALAGLLTSHSYLKEKVINGLHFVYTNKVPLKLVYSPYAEIFIENNCVTIINPYVTNKNSRKIPYSLLEKLEAVLKVLILKQVFKFFGSISTESMYKFEDRLKKVVFENYYWLKYVKFKDLLKNESRSYIYLVTCTAYIGSKGSSRINDFNETNIRIIVDLIDGLIKDMPYVQLAPGYKVKPEADMLLEVKNNLIDPNALTLYKNVIKSKDYVSGYADILTN